MGIETLKKWSRNSEKTLIKKLKISVDFSRRVVLLFGLFKSIIRKE